MTDRPTDPAPEPRLTPTTLPSVRFPEPDSLADLGERVATLSDSLLSPDGRIAQLASQVDRALGKLDTLIGLVTLLANHVTDHGERIKQLELRAKRHSGLLAAVVPANMLGDDEGNGAGHGDAE